MSNNFRKPSNKEAEKILKFEYISNSHNVNIYIMNTEKGKT